MCTSKCLRLYQVSKLYNLALHGKQPEQSCISSGYQFVTSDSLKTLAVHNEKTPAECLVSCESTSRCKALFVGTNDLQEAGVCYLYSRVLQRSDITPTSITLVGSIRATKGKSQSKRAIHHPPAIQVISGYKYNVVLNRE